MEGEALTQIADIIAQGMISAVFIWAWWQERKERQERERAHSEERNTFVNELIDLAREAYGLKSRTHNLPPPVSAVDRLNGSAG